MLNAHLPYKPPSSYRIIFWYGGCPRQFSHLEKFSALVNPRGVCHKEIILQGMQLTSGFPLIVQSFLIRKGDLTGSPDHAPIQNNSLYRQPFIWCLYKNRHPEYHFLPTCTNSWSCYNACISTKTYKNSFPG